MERLIGYFYFGTPHSITKKVSMKFVVVRTSTTGASGDRSTTMYSKCVFNDRINDRILSEARRPLVSAIRARVDAGRKTSPVTGSVHITFS